MVLETIELPIVLPWDSPTTLTHVIREWWEYGSLGSLSLPTYVVQEGFEPPSPLEHSFTDCVTHPCQPYRTMVLRRTTNPNMSDSWQQRIQPIFCSCRSISEKGVNSTFERHLVIQRESNPQSPARTQALTNLTIV